jgi:hypothetical protein
MDLIAKRSATLATLIHACLVAVAFAPRGCSEIPDPTTPPAAVAQRADPVPAPAAAPDTHGRLVAAPLASPAASTLPTLGADDLPPLPAPGQLVSAVRQDHAGQEVQRGAGRSGAALTELPALAANPDDLIARLQRGAVSNETLSREQRMLGSAQEFLHGRLQGRIDGQWRHLLKQVTQPRLVIELSVDRMGRLRSAHLVNSSGSLALDRLIGEWLQAGDLGLPPITPDIVYPFLIVIRR